MSSVLEIYKPTITPEIYWKQYLRVLNCCGKVAYYDRSRDGVERGSAALTEIAYEYGHNVKYYGAKTKKWLKRRDEALHIFNKSLIELELPYLTKKTGRELLYLLTFNPDYRSCCYASAKYGLKKEIILSLAEIDARYDKRLRRRRKNG